MFKKFHLFYFMLFKFINKSDFLNHFKRMNIFKMLEIITLLLYKPKMNTEVIKGFKL